MKITACNLRSIIGPVTIEVKDKMVLNAINGAGKSTMAMVPYFVLTGKGLTIRNGATGGYGIIEFADISILRQKEKGNTTIRVNGKVCSETAMYEHLNKRGYNPDVLCALFDAETVLDSETMLKVAAMQLDVEKILSFTNLTGGERDMLANYFDSNGVQIVSIPDINKGYKKFYSMRTDNNRTVKSMRALVEADMPFADKQVINVATLVANSTVVEEEITKLSQEIFQSEQISRRISDLNAIIARDVAECSRLENMKCAYGEVDIQTVSERIDALRKAEEVCSEEITVGNAQLTSLNEQLMVLREKRNGVVENGKAKRSIFDALSQAKTCPLYHGLSCTTNMTVAKENIGAEVEALRSECRALDAEIATLNQRIMELRQKIEAAESKRRATREEYNRLVSERSMMEKERTAFAAVEGKLVAIRNTIALNKNELTTLAVTDVTTTKQKLSDKKAELASIKTAIVDASKISDAVRRLTENSKKLEDAEKLSASYTTIIRELDVLPNKIFERIIAPIEAGLNQVLAEIKPDWSMKFEFDGANIAIHVVTPAGNININEVSTGERIVVNYVFKALICKLVNFDTIILDNTDALDEKNYAMVETVVARSAYSTLLITCNSAQTQFTTISI